MNELALESFIGFCDDMTIAEEGSIKNTITNTFNRFTDVINILISKIQSMIVGLKKKKTLYVPHDYLTGFKIAYVELDKIIGNFRDNVDTLLESGDIPDEGVLQQEAIKNQKERIIDIVNSNPGKVSHILSDSIDEVPAEKYVKMCQIAHQELQRMYKLAKMGRLADQKSGKPDCSRYLAAYLSAVKTQIWWLGLILKHDRKSKEES